MGEKVGKKTFGFFWGGIKKDLVPEMSIYPSSDAYLCNL